jgi:predicted esterase
MLVIPLASANLEPTRFDLADRVKRLDEAWVANRDPKRREAAVAEVSGAVMAFFSGRTADACRALDRARAVLLDRPVSGLDALIVRSDPPVVNPNAKVQLKFGWAYPFSEKVTIRVLGDTYEVDSKLGLTVTMNAANTEGLQLVTIESAGSSRTFTLQVVNDFPARVAKLKASPQTSAMAAALEQAAAGTYETEIPVLDWLTRGEIVLKEGWKAVEEVPAARSGSVPFRALIPKGARSDAPVVIALHGAGGSENMFFESYGAGVGPKEAQKRGWVFMSPRSVPGAVPACLAWLREERDITPRKVFVMGHSMGGAVALSKETLGAKPDALALFAPASGGRLPADTRGMPIFLAVGKQEMAMLRTTASQLGSEITARPNSKFKEYDRCEHLMIVAEAMTDAFAFFDNLLTQRLFASDFGDPFFPLGRESSLRGGNRL